MNHRHRQRTLIAQEAARLMVEHGIRDFAVAKKSALSHLGLNANDTPLPRNQEIALEKQSLVDLFYSQSTSDHLHTLHQTAHQALIMLSPFSPYLVGEIVENHANQHSPVTIHLYDVSVEQVELFLHERSLPFRHEEVQLKISRSHHHSYPRLSFLAGEIWVEIVVLPLERLKSPPLSPLDGRAIKRVSLKRFTELFGHSIRETKKAPA